MLLHLGKAYYALEAKAMATDDLVPGPSWDLDCDCGGPDGPPPPPFFHLPPPPRPPGILGPLKESQSEDCLGPWTCPALALEAGGSFGRFDEGGPPQASPEVPPIAVIIVSAAVLGLFLLVAAIIVVSRLWRSYKASSKKASCDLDGADLYEDMPAAPPLLPAPHHCPPPLRYKDPMLPPPRGGLPPTPALHLYSPEPRPDTPSDHLYHHISSGSETCSCSTSEAPSNALLPSSLQLIHSEEDEASSHSSHSYNSSSTATPASSPTPATGGHPHRPPASLYLCPPTVSGGPPTVLLPGYVTALQYAGGKFRHPSSQHSTVYAVNPVNDGHHKHGGTTHDNNMVPLAQIYAPGSHLYEAATLIRPNSNLVPKCSMMHWGNVPAPFVQAVNSHQTLKPNTVHDPRHHHPGTTVPMHSTVVHPLQYSGQNGCMPHTCMQHGPSSGMDSDQYHPPSAYAHHQHQPYGHPHHPPARHHPTHLPLPLHSSTLIPNVKLSKSMYNVARSPEDITPTNSIPTDSIYNVDPHSGVDLIATTCLSTVSSIPNQNDYSLTLDAINLNNTSSHLKHRHPEDPGHATALSDTSSSSHPSSGTEGATVTESSSLDSSGTTSSTIPLTNSMGSQRRDLPPLPSRADRYRIYAHNNEANASGRFNSCRRPANNNNIDNNNVGNGTVGMDDSHTPRNVKSCDDLNNISPVDNPRLLQQHHLGGKLPDASTPAMEESNVANNNYPSYGGGQPSQPLLAPLSLATSGKRNQLSCDEDHHRQPGAEEELFSRPPFPSHRSTPRRGPRPGVISTENEHEDHDVIYDSCSDT